MYTLRCTRKLLRRLGETPSSASIAPSTVLGDWYANLLYTRPQQLVLAMNERSLLCVLVPAREIGQLGPRLSDAVSGLLLAIGVPAGAVQSEAQAMDQMAIGATASRAVLGCMNDALFQLRAYPRERAGELDLRDAELYLAENIYSLTDYEPPWRRAHDLFGSASQGSVMVRTRTLH